MGEQRSLSQKSTTVLEFIARGHSYEQILSADSSLTYLDIFNAAQEALDVAQGASHDYTERLADIRQAHPRAYEKWSDEEDARLAQLVHEGISVKNIADLLHRQASAIRSRITKLNLATERHS